MLMDSAHIQEMEAEWKNRKAQRSGGTLEEPLYTTVHATETINLFTPCTYQTPVQVCEGIVIELVDVGHLLGSASILVTVTEAGKNAAHCVLRGYWQPAPAAFARPGLHHGRGLCGDGIHLRRPRPRPHSRLCGNWRES